MTHAPLERLGWDFRPHQTNHWPIPLEDVPRLSPQEEQVLREITHELFQEPTPRDTAAQRKERIRKYAESHFLVLTPAQVQDLEHVLALLTQGYGPLDGLLRDPRIEEIALTGIGSVHPVRVYHTKHGWMETPLYFTDTQVVLALINRFIRTSGKRLAGSTPIVNAFLPEGSRLHASMAPVSLTPIEFSIRKFVARAQSLNDLLALGVISSEALEDVRLALATDCNILIVGNTGSGKTTTLNALASQFPLHERLILVEETPELQVQHPHVVRLTPHTGIGLDMSALIRETLRMRPDRVIVGEIRFPEEGRAFMESVLAGQGKGTYATFHGHSAQEALSRLRQFGLLESDLGWINLILVQRRWSVQRKDKTSREMRAITEIVELQTNENRVHIHSLFNWNPLTQKLARANQSRLLNERIAQYFPGKTIESVRNVIQKKEKS